ncbi:MAG: response regulator [Candidatus Dormibacteria bacterium]
MIDRSEALLLEDDPEQLALLAAQVSAAGLLPLVARSAAEAIRLLDPSVHQPVIALVDRDLSRSPDRSRRSEEVLRRLYQDHPSCIAIVFSANLDSVEARAQVHHAHPRVLLHDKREGVPSLLARVRELVCATVGDLSLTDGRVLHVPSGRSATHRVAVTLVMSHQGGRATMIRGESGGRAARRFASWLEEVKSSVRVEALGGYMYRLLVEASHAPLR